MADQEYSADILDEQAAPLLQTTSFPNPEEEAIQSPTFLSLQHW
jgi:hypothetical protein